MTMKFCVLSDLGKGLARWTGAILFIISAFFVAAWLFVTLLWVIVLVPLVILLACGVYVMAPRTFRNGFKKGWHGNQARAVSNN